MLNTRIKFQTEDIPYKVHRKIPEMLQPYFKEEDHWFAFCDRLDRMLRSYEEIKAAWMVLGVGFVILCLGMIAGVLCRFFLVDDEQLGLILSGSLFGGIFLVFTGYFFLMQLWVVKPLNELTAKVNECCDETTIDWDNVTFQFERSGSCSIYWDSKFDAWINVEVDDPA